MKPAPATFLFVCIVFLLAACRPAATQIPTATITPDLRTPLAMTAEAQTQLAADAQATADTQATEDMVAATAAAEATASAESANATATVFMQQTETKATSQARSTETWGTRTAATEQAIVDATAQAQPIVNVIADLQSEGLLSLTEGEYIQLADFDESWAQLNWFQWYPTFLSPSNFVIRVDIAYESASDTADWWNSGCGFVFRQEDNNNFYVTFLNMDGNVEVSRWRNGNGSNLSRGYYGKLDLPKGAAEMILAVENNWITVLINGVKTVRLTDSSFTSGNLSYTLVSGTNKDYGTRCQMTNVDLWEFR